MNRRSFIVGLAALIAAPAVVRATSLMPIKLLPADPEVLLQAYISGIAHWRWVAYPNNALICPKRGALIDLWIAPPAPSINVKWAGAVLPPSEPPLGLSRTNVDRIRVERPANIDKPLLVAPDIIERGRVRAVWLQPDGRLVDDHGAC